MSDVGLSQPRRAPRKPDVLHVVHDHQFVSTTRRSTQLRLGHLLLSPGSDGQHRGEHLPLDSRSSTGEDVRETAALAGGKAGRSTAFRRGSELISSAVVAGSAVAMF